MDFRRQFCLFWQLWNLVFLVYLSVDVIAADYPPVYPVKNRKAFACEDSYIYLNCPEEGENIRILLANYGRFSLVVCNQDGVHSGWDLQCTAKQSITIVKEKCDGRKHCTFLASNRVFGDPCPGTKKYIEIRYFCEKVDVESTSVPAKTTPAKTTARITTTRTPPTTTHVEGSKEKWGTDEVCASTERDGVFWPVALAGSIVEQSCPYDMTGSATWYCGRNRKWRGKPDLTDCVSPWMQDIQSLMENDAQASVPVQRLNQRMANKQIIGAGDLKRAAIGILPGSIRKMKSTMRELDQAGVSVHKRRDKVHSFTKEVVKSSSYLLSTNQSGAWGELRRSDRKLSASSLIVSLEQLALEVASTITDEETLSTTEENIVMEVSVVKVNISTRNRNLKLPLKEYTSMAGSKDQVLLPMDGFKGISDTGPEKVSVTFLLYKNIEEFLSPGVLGDDTHNETIVINTRVISASVNKHSIVSPTDWLGVTELTRPMNFTLQHRQVLENYKPLCSFWDFNVSTLEGEWSQQGCRVVETSDSQTTCQCDHLTNFAILMDVAGTKLSRMHEMALRAITYVGCVVSIVCLFMCLVSFIIFPNLQSDRNTIHKNLVLCLMIAELLFIFGIGQTENKLTCSIIAAFLHFFFLTSFSWMCLEGIQLYFMLIEVFEAERSRVRWFYLFGYGVPAFVVAVSALADYTGYGTDTHCWLRTDNLFILSFVIPAGIVILINIAMLSIAVYMMCRHANVTAASIQKRQKGKLEKMSNRQPGGKNSIVSEDSVKSRREMPTWLKGSAVLVVLLGLTWCFGFMYVNEDSIAMAYIFTVLNSLQGLFIFIFHCFMDRKVKKEWRKAIKKCTWLPMCCRVNIGGYAGNLSSPSPSSSSGPHYYFLRFLSSRRRKRSSTSSASNKRRSDLDSFLVDSSSGGTTKTGLNRFSNQSDKLLPNGQGSNQLPVHYESGVHGDLSVVDASVIDSEYVTEYCQHNMQVSNEKRRYSSGSEDEGDKDNVSRESTSKHRLSFLSTDSDLKIQSDFQSEVKSDFASDNEEGKINYAVLENGEDKKMPVYENISKSDKNLLNNLLNYVQDEMLTPLEGYDEQGFKKGLVPDDSNIRAPSRDKLGVTQGKDNTKAVSAPNLKISNLDVTYGNGSYLMDTSGQPLLGSVPDVAANGDQGIDGQPGQSSGSSRLQA